MSTSQTSKFLALCKGVHPDYWSPLQSAINAEVCEVLITAKANINAIDKVSKCYTVETKYY